MQSYDSIWLIHPITFRHHPTDHEIDLSIREVGVEFPLYAGQYRYAILYPPKTQPLEWVLWCFIRRLDAPPPRPEPDDDILDITGC
jgi:hypothetical protein